MSKFLFKRSEILQLDMGMCGQCLKNLESQIILNTAAAAAAAAKLLQSCPTLCDHIRGSPPGSLFMGFPSQEYWRGWPFPSPRDPPDPGIEPTSPASAGRFFTAEPPGKTKPIIGTHVLNKYTDTDDDQPLEESSWSISQFIPDS